METPYADCFNYQAGGFRVMDVSMEYKRTAVPFHGGEQIVCRLTTPLNSEYACWFFYLMSSFSLVGRFVDSDMVLRY